MEENNQEQRVLDVPKIFLYIFEVIVLILLISYVYFAMSGNKEYSGVYSEHAQKQVIEALFTSLNLESIHEIPYLGMTLFGFDAVIQILQYQMNQNRFLNP